MRREYAKAAGWAALVLLALAGGTYAVRGVADWKLWAPLGLGLASALAWAAVLRQDILGFLASRRSRQGGLSLVYTAAVLVALGLLQSLLVNSDLSLDLSQNKAYTLADETAKALRGLESRVQVYAFYGPENRGAFEDLLKRARRVNPAKLDYEFVDPNAKPLLAQQYGVRSLGTAVLVAGEQKETVSGSGEEDLLNALLKLSAGAAKQVYFLSGHQERSLDDEQAGGLSGLKAGLQSSGFKVASLNLAAAKGGVPADAAALVIAGPRRDLNAPELALLDRYLARGGRLLAAADPRSSLPAFKAWLAKSGLLLGEDLAVEMNLFNRLAGGSPVALVIQAFDREHPATKDLVEQQVQAVFPLARTVSLAAQLPAGASGSVLARSMPTAFGWTGAGNQLPAKPGPGDRKGPLDLMAAVEAPASLYGKDPQAAEAKARLVALGSSSLLANQAVGAFNNQDLAVNSLRWLANEEKRIALAPKPRTNQPLLLDAGRQALVWLAVLLLCLGALVTALLVRLRRQRAA